MRLESNRTSAIEAIGCMVLGGYSQMNASNAYDRAVNAQQQAFDNQMALAQQQFNTRPYVDPYKDETDEEREARKLREVKYKLEQEWVTMPPSILPANWKPLGKWEMFKLNIGLKLIRFGER